MDKEEIRAMIKAEVRAALESLAAEAEDLDGYHTNPIESAALQAVAQSARSAAQGVGCSLICEGRTNKYVGCTCGAQR